MTQSSQNQGSDEGLARLVDHLICARQNISTAIDIVEEYPEASRAAFDADVDIDELYSLIDVAIEVLDPGEEYR